MRIIVAADSLPKVRLGTEPVVDSPAALETALEELSWLESVESTKQAALKQKVDLLKREVAAQLVVKCGRKEITFADRRKALSEAVEAFCLKEWQSLLEDGKKSREFTHGTIQFRAQPARVAIVEGKTEESVFEAVEKKTGWWAAVLKVLAKVVFGAVRIDQVIRVDRAINYSALNAAMKTGSVTAQDLKPLGLEIVQAPEKFSLKLNEYTVRSEETAAA